METLVLVLAAFILVAGILLWRADAAKKRPPLVDAPVERPGTPEPEPAPVTPEPEQAPVAPEPEQAPVVYPEVGTEVDSEAEAGLAEVPEVRGSGMSVDTATVVPVPVPAPEPESLPEPFPEVAGETGQRGVEKHSFLHTLSGAPRRERRHWAARHGFDYLKEDAFLTDEWSRGAAATGAMARDVVSGMAEGYEMHLVDLAGVPVMAMRRGVISDVVIDARRGDDPEQSAESEDLLEIDTVSGFRVLSNTAGVAQRFIDERVRVALEAMPEVVRAVWMESDWVLAEMGGSATPEDWENILQPLALLTDASFTLPPRGGAGSARGVDFDLLAPSRLSPEKPDDPRERSTHPEEDLSQPLVIRPEEPLQMPVRAQQQSRGVVEPRPLGADDVDSIAEGVPQRPSDLHGTRVLRELNGRSSIFDDTPDDIGEGHTPGAGDRDA